MRWQRCNKDVWKADEVMCTTSDRHRWGSQSCSVPSSHPLCKVALGVSTSSPERNGPFASREPLYLVIRLSSFSIFHPLQGIITEFVVTRCLDMPGKPNTDIPN